MERVIRKNCIFILSVFFAISPNIKAMNDQGSVGGSERSWRVVSAYLDNPEIPEIPQIPQILDVPDISEGGRPSLIAPLENPRAYDDLDDDSASVAASSSSGSAFSVASKVIPVWKIPLQKMRFDIIKEACARIAIENNITDLVEYITPINLSDRRIERAANRNRRVLYLSAANIRAWQIAKKVLEGIDEKIEESPSIGLSMEYLRSFRDETFREYSRALDRRKVFLADALKIAAELSVWKTVYDAYRSHFEAEHAEASERVLVFFNDQSMMLRCENLYKAKDSVDTDSLRNSVQDCRAFVDEIKVLLAPLVSSPMGEVSIGEYAQKEKFLEDVKRAFESPAEMSSFFNPEDGAVFLSVLADCLAFYRTQRANLEAQVAERAARIASDQAAMEAQRAVAEERAARIASDQAAMEAQRALAEERAARIASDQAAMEAQRAAAQALEAERINYEALIRAERTRNEAAMAAMATRNEANAEAAAMRAAAAAAAARVTAESLENAMRARSEADAAAAQTRAQAQRSLAEAEAAAEIARLRTEAAVQAERKAELAQWRVTQDAGRYEAERTADRVWGTSVVGALGVGAGTLVYVAGSPVLVPATLLGMAGSIVGSTLWRIFR